MTNTLRHLARTCLAVLLTSSAFAHASGGTGEYTLDWPVRGELLAYHSSGCADACWVAEVRKKSTRHVRARLRCDGDQLYFSQAGKSREQLLPEGCANYNDSNDKLQLITDKLMVLLRGGNKAQPKGDGLSRVQH